MSSVILVGLSFLAGLFMAWIIGAAGASASFGPAISARAISVFQGALVLGLATLVGAIHKGGAVADTMKGGLVTITLDPVLASIVLLIAASLILIGVITKYPLPKVFVIVGSLLGTAYGAGGAMQVDRMATLVFFWLVIPFVAVGIGYVTAILLRRYVPKNDQTRKYINMVLFAVATYTAYIAGANQVGLAVGPLENLVDGWSQMYFLVFGGIGMMVGAWTGSPRLIEAVARDYSKMGPRRAISALLAASSLAHIATLYGVPVSFNQAILSSIIGAGLVGGRGDIGTRKIVVTVGAWIGAMVLSFVLAYGITWVINAV